MERRAPELQLEMEVVGGTPISATTSMMEWMSGYCGQACTTSFEPCTGSSTDFHSATCNCTPPAHARESSGFMCLKILQRIGFC